MTMILFCGIYVCREHPDTGTVTIIKHTFTNTDANTVVKTNAFTDTDTVMKKNAFTDTHTHTHTFF